ncbi:MAG: polyprenyl synthetase family protein [Acidobacteriota bacterium]
MKVATSPTAERSTTGPAGVGHVLSPGRPSPAAVAPIDTTGHLESVPGLPVGVDLLARLEGICAHRGLGNLADRLSDMVAFIGQDLEQFELELDKLPRNERRVNHSAHHLLERGGKRLRPMCVALASRMGTGFDHRALDLAVAVELVHNATLLHDDVVDVSDVRRGAPTARTVYGNAASIFAGDWLLIEALRRVNRSGLPGVLEELFAIIEEMILAESLQLETRGLVSADRGIYFQVVEGKTASVFRWAMSAGGHAGGLDESHRAQLVDYGRHLGITFQATDDLLDLTGDSAKTGKMLFTDLREGKMTFPMIVALERDPELRPIVEEILAEEEVTDQAAERVVSALRETRAVEECRRLARRHSDQALAALAVLPDGRARRALATVAESIVDRDL